MLLLGAMGKGQYQKHMFWVGGAILYLEYDSADMTLPICPNSQNCRPEKANFTAYKFKI